MNFCSRKNWRMICPVGLILLGLSWQTSLADYKDEAAASINGFATDLYGTLAQGPDSNLFFSPFSISTALAMTWAGAVGKTADEMASVLHFNGRTERTHSAFHELLESLSTYLSGSDTLDVSVSNALWTDIRFPLNPDYIAIVKDQYHAYLQQVSYRTPDIETTRQTRNNRIAEDTRGRIKELLAKRDINGLTVLILTNAIYFKGNWLSQFAPENTQGAPFYTNNGGTVQVDMMHQIVKKRVFRYYDEDGFQLLEFPYVGDKLVMDIVLPESSNGIKDIEARLDENLGEWLSKLKEQDRLLDLHFPKLDVSYRSYLKEILVSMGMSLAFSTAAEFGEMFLPGNSEATWIDEVIHEANITVDEEGTVAAAATAVIMTRSAEPPETITFRADHPFILLIRERDSGAILFMGRIMNPLEGKS